MKELYMLVPEDVDGTHVLVFRQRMDTAGAKEMIEEYLEKHQKPEKKWRGFVCDAAGMSNAQIVLLCICLTIAVPQVESWRR